MKAVNDILYAKVVPTKQMIRGLEMKSEILDNYVKEHKHGHCSLSVQKSGFIVGKLKTGFLELALMVWCMIPLALMIQMVYWRWNLLVQRKMKALIMPWNAKNICIQDSKRDRVTLNRNHKYFCQIQQGIYLSDWNWTDFVVAGLRSPGMLIERE